MQHILTWSVMGPEHIPLLIEIVKTLFVFGLGVILMVGVIALEDWRKIRRGRKMNKKLQLVRISWECPRCECRGGYGGPDMNLIVGLCVPTLENAERVHCFGCGWIGDLEDATITVVEVPRNML